MEQMPTDWERALAVVAHPDDLEYGAAGAIAAWTAAGKHVVYVLATRGEAGIDGIPPDECAKLREAEQRASAAIVGVDVVDFLDHHDGVIEEGLPLRRDLVAAIRRHKPELVVTLNHRETWGNGAWNTPDHRALGRSLLDATTSAGNRWLFPGDLEPWDGVRWTAIAASSAPTHEIDIADTFEAAVQSLAAHAAYIRGLNANEDVDPVAYAREFLTSMCVAEEGARPKISFELLAR